MLRKPVKIVSSNISERHVEVVENGEFGLVRLIGLYVPADDQGKSSYLPLLESIPTMPEVKTIVTGDFNFVESPEDRTSEFNPKFAYLWQIHTAHLNLVDIPPLQKRFTYLK